MTPVVEVLQLSDAFAQVWDQLVRSAGGQARVHEDAEAFSSGDGTCGAIIVAAGAEPDALGVLELARRRGRIPMVVVGATADHRLTVSLLKRGADDFFVLPDDLSAVRAWVEGRIEGAANSRRVREHSDGRRGVYDFSRMIGRSPGLHGALQRAGRVIPKGRATVLITGETGTGKELLARAIHYNGPRSERPFVEINCAALPANLLEAELFGYERGAFTDAKVAKPGLFEAANGGTLFLDEIGELSLELQAKLLRALETKRVRRLGSVRDQEVDVRIIAATHVDLATASQQGRFRQDLYYRLSVVPLHLPPLRERGEDVILLAEHFLDTLSHEYAVPRPELTPEVRRALLGSPWLGNIRELKNAMERAVVLSDGVLQVEDLAVAEAAAPARGEGVLPFPAPLATIEVVAAREALEMCNGNKSEAAKVLGISRRHLYTLLNRLSSVEA